MFDVVRNNKRIVQAFLALITLPFAFFGVESYVRSARVGEEVAKVGDVKITQQEFQQAVREQQERLRAQLGERFDPKMLDHPEFRKSIVDDLINQRVLLIEAGKNRMFASDDSVVRTIAGLPAFQEDGKFSRERYENALRAQGMSPTSFEAQLRHDLTLQQLANGVAQSSLVAHTVSDRVLAMQTEKREVAEFRLNSDAMVAKVVLAEGAAKKFYDENARQFQMPELAKVEYLVLSMDTIGSQLTVNDAEVKAWYEEHKSRYQQPEERRASHILVGLEKLGKDKAKARAEELLAEVRKNPAAFADIAKKSSDDPGSAAKGGDLGYFGRGMMVKPFEDAVYSQKEGEISGVVESDFGFHIIKVTGIHAAKEKPFADVRAEIEDELRKASAGRKFAEAAESFSNLVYEQADSLKPAAEKFKLTVKQSDWIGRQPNLAAGVLGNEKLLAAVFSEDSLKSRRNTEAVEVAPNTLVAARIVDYKPSAQQPFESVKANIESLLKRQEAQKLARQEGEAQLAKLRAGDDKLAWGTAHSVSRLDARQVAPQVAQVVFRLDASKLPAYTGVELPGSGYALVRLSKVEPGDKVDDARKQGLQQQLFRLSAQEDFQSYLAALRSRYKVEINSAALEVKER